MREGKGLEFDELHGIIESVRTYGLLAVALLFIFFPLDRAPRLFGSPTRQGWSKGGWLTHGRSASHTDIRYISSCGMYL